MRLDDGRLKSGWQMVPPVLALVFIILWCLAVALLSLLFGGFLNEQAPKP